jgi:hypothetical protein
MVKKFVIFIAAMICFMTTSNCKSPEEPRRPESYYWYRYNVEVIYSDVAEGESDFPLYLYYGLYDLWGSFDSGYIKMDKTGEKRARCYIPKVLCNVYDGKEIIGEAAKHWVSVVDPNKSPWCHRGENIEIQGGYELEISTSTYCSVLLFKMSKD